MATRSTTCGACGVMGRGSGPLAVTASAGRFDTEYVTGSDLESSLARNRGGPFAAQQCVLPGRAGLAAEESIGSALASIGEDGDVGTRQKFIFPNDAVATAMVARAAGAGANAIAANAQWILVLESFHRRVPAIGHVRVSGAGSIGYRR